jgi:4-hydroxy-2-oxoheptanedioate aldolase
MFPEVLKAIELIAERANKAGVMPGIHVGSVAYGKRCRDMGYRLITYLSDFRMLQQAAARGIAAMRAFEPAPGVA